ncbi:MAG: zincin-like metallopeptidase domain-containing protein, partial [Burkholderiales bacterium]
MDAALQFIGCIHCAQWFLSSQDNAEFNRAHRIYSRLLPAPCGIIPVSALWVLCRYRHKTHATGHSSRLDRAGITQPAKFGSERYSKEELIAELGAAFLS